MEIRRKHRSSSANSLSMQHKFPLFTVDLGSALCLGLLQMSSLLHHRELHHHHTAIVSAEGRGYL